MGDEDRALFSRVVELLRDYRREGRAEDLPRLEQACEEVRSYARQNPDSVPALRLLAELAQQTGHIQEAFEYIDRAERLDPWNLEILVVSEALRESAAERRRGPDEAVRVSAGLISEPVSPDKIAERAMGSFKLGDLERAYSLAKLAYRLNPEMGHHLLDVWTIGSAMDPQRCCDELDLLVREAPTEPYLYLALGSTNNVLGLYDEAASWLHRGLQLPSSDPYAVAMLHNELAYVLLKSGGSLDDCIRLARTALDIFPDKQANGFIRDTLGVAYLKQGQLDKAIRNLREAVSKDSTSIPRLHLAVALIQTGDAAGALAELRLVASAKASLDSPHVEETRILQRVQAHIQRLEDLLNLGGADDLEEAHAILVDLL
ncbi:MAG: tetratricopeptide repeat protein [Deltaproteobacteria bacterium]|nr:tetratricopeptide repeat protein [Deltaproteobacteria bacterium]